MREIIFNILYVLLKNEEHTKGDTTFEVVLDMIQIYSFTFNSSVSSLHRVVVFNTCCIGKLPVEARWYYVLPAVGFQHRAGGHAVQLY
jgi:hypothetical protein